MRPASFILPGLRREELGLGQSGTGTSNVFSVTETMQ
jgi:hypothetical protein